VEREFVGLKTLVACNWGEGGGEGESWSDAGWVARLPRSVILGCRAHQAAICVVIDEPPISTNVTKFTPRNVFK